MKHTWIILTVMAAGAAVSLLAQETPQAPGGPGRGPGPHGPGFGPGRMGPPPFMLALDADKDGVLTAAEISTAPTQLMSLDKNSDKQLTPDELRPTPPQGVPQQPDRPGFGRGKGKGNGPGMGEGKGPGMGQGKGPGMGEGRGPRGPMGLPPVLAQIDADKDGVLSQGEIQNASAALLKLDLNNDGQLTPEELHPGFDGPRGPRGPRGPGAGTEGAAGI